jgi:YHS domain-containing protein
MANNRFVAAATNRRSVLGALGLVAFLPLVFPLALPAAAKEPAVFTGLIEGTGAGGYDVVAYFTENAAVAGDAAISVQHDGVSYRFASTANRDAFQADPARYLPEFGGYCAYAVANGYTAKIDPEAFSVVDGRLFLNYSKSVRRQWQANQAQFIVDGDANWPKVLDK